MRHDTPTVIVDQGASVMHPQCKQAVYTSNIFIYILIAIVIAIIAVATSVYRDVYSTTVYACSEVNKNDPQDVQKLCKQLRKIYDQ